MDVVDIVCDVVGENENDAVEVRENVGDGEYEYDAVDERVSVGDGE